MKRCVIDTNVMVTANKAVNCMEDDTAGKYPALIENCIKFLNDIKEKEIYVVLDMDSEILNKYRNNLNPSGQPGVGDAFFKWLFSNCWGFPSSERIKLHKTEKGYEEFPIEMDNLSVDKDDKKFFAVSNAHQKKPDIFEAVDSKWWNWRPAALNCGIHIRFLDEQYMRDYN